MSAHTTTARRVMPGPPGLPLVGNTLQLARDPLGFLLSCARSHSDPVYLRVRGLPVYLLTSPSAIEGVLVREHRKFTVDRLSKGLADALGSSLLVSEGEFWERQRRLVQPAFHRSRIEQYAVKTATISAERFGSWRDGETIDVFAEMMGLTLDIITKVLLDVDLSSKVRIIQRYLDAAMHHILGVGNTGVRLPVWIPTPGNMICGRAMRRFDSLVYALIRERRGQQAEGSDLVSLLLSSRDGNGERMTDQQLRDEISTMVLVGHETSGLALTYACWLLSQHSEASERLRAEVEEVLGNRVATFADLERLPFAQAVFSETLRLYPPVWAFGREALEQCEIGGFTIPAGAQILFSPWVSHRDPRFFPDPEAFLPQRWLQGAAAELPRFAYFPFGGGPRLCLGHRFATMESLLILATLAQHFTLHQANGSRLDLLPTITLRPRKPVRLTVATRSKHP